MKWVKFQHCYKHGYGQVEYHPVVEGYDVEDIVSELRNGPDGDPDGFRMPKWEVIDSPPPEVLAKMIEQEHSLILSHERWVAVLESEQLKLVQANQTL